MAGRALIVGEAQGGVIALLLACVWAEKVRAVVAVDAEVPALQDEAGLGTSGMDGLPVLLVAAFQRPVSATDAFLDELGLRSDVRSGSATVVNAWHALRAGSLRCPRPPETHTHRLAAGLAAVPRVLASLIRRTGSLSRLHGYRARMRAFSSASHGPRVRRPTYRVFPSAVQLDPGE